MRTYIVSYRVRGMDARVELPNRWRLALWVLLHADKLYSFHVTRGWA